MPQLRWQLAGFVYAFHRRVGISFSSNFMLCKGITCVMRIKVVVFVYLHHTMHSLAHAHTFNIFHENDAQSSATLPFTCAMRFSNSCILSHAALSLGCALFNSLLDEPCLKPILTTSFQVTWLKVGNWIRLKSSFERKVSTNWVSDGKCYGKVWTFNLIWMKPFI